MTIDTRTPRHLSTGDTTPSTDAKPGPGDTCALDLNVHRAAPYAEALTQHADSGPLHLMVPGHGCDTEEGFPDLVSWLGPAVGLDLPPMQDGIDLGPDSPLAQAEALAAEAWGAGKAWFLTNGASQANRTAALAIRGLGERVMMQRGAHSSFIDGVLLAGLDPTFVMPSVDSRHGIAHGVAPESLREALIQAQEQGRTPEAVYVVSPSYFGSVADVAGLADVAHEFGAALVVDGAWGAHFGFHSALPESPTRLGADLVISSTHKLGGALTQAAMLHLGHGDHAQRLEPLVMRALAMTSSTSESALLKASLDLARRGLVLGSERIGEQLAAAESIREGLLADGRFGIVSEGFTDFADVVATDGLRLPIDVSATGQTGHWFRQRLARGHGVNLEMATATTVVGVLGAVGTADVGRTLAAFAAVADTAGSSHSIGFPSLPATGPLRRLPREAYFGSAEVVAASQAVGRVSADTLAAYPPGIPNVIPGEEITSETVEFLQAVAASPTGYVRGSLNPDVSVFRVVAQA